MPKQNPTSIHAVIIFNGKKLDRIIPDEFEAAPGTTVEWKIVPPNQARVFFLGETPFDWDSNPSDGKHEQITGTVRLDAEEKPYKYSVEDMSGDIIDPRIRVKR
jgi:hypothetical protein